MSFTLNGVQQNSKPGADFNTQYNVPDTGLTNMSTLSNNMLYALAKLVFEGAEANNISGYNKNDLLMDNGLVRKADKGNHKVFTQV